MAQRLDRGPSVPPYGVAIHNAIATGDLAQMRRIAQEAEIWLREQGDVGAALELLKTEIARRDAARK
jgi:Domain of unknown function (DUF1843)